MNPNMPKGVDLKRKTIFIDTTLIDMVTNTPAFPACILYIGDCRIPIHKEGQKRVNMGTYRQFLTLFSQQRIERN